MISRCCAGSESTCPPRGKISNSTVAAYLAASLIGSPKYSTMKSPFMHTVPQVDIYGTQAMASAGFAVLFPMPRGGSGYGVDGFKMIR
jgi:hypothetical protein